MTGDFLMGNIYVTTNREGGISALFTITKTWKEPRCPLIEEWIKKIWYMYIMEYYLAIKKNEIKPFAAT